MDGETAVSPRTSTKGKEGAVVCDLGLRSQLDTVARRIRRASHAELTLTSGKTRKVNLFAPVGEGDKIKISRNRVDVLTDDGSYVPLRPTWSKSFSVMLGPKPLRLTIKEVETEAEINALTKLKQFHYRGEKSAGRAVPLIAVVDHPLMPRVIGFIELTSALLVNTARKAVLDRAFRDKQFGVAWRKWDMNTAKKHTKRLARISRCVVYPELRGLGIAPHLASAAAQYASQRWQFGGARPLFIEITADMLRYAPFVEAAEFTYVGETQGNETRMLRDMSYLLRRTIASGSVDDFPQGGGGIMMLQRAYATTLLEVMNRRRLKLSQLLNLLRQSPERLSDDEWISLHRVFRRPKPTYMRGLTKCAELHLRNISAAVGRRPRSSPTRLLRSKAEENLAAVLSVSKLKLATTMKPSTTPRARRVAEAFGIVAKEIEVTLFEGLDLEVHAGEIVVLTGPSGTGKSLLLKSFASLLGGDSLKLTSVRLTAVSVSGTAHVAWVDHTIPLGAPIDELPTESIEKSLALLADAGLAEASLFIRPVASLSDGQRYRFALARAFAKDPKLLLADEFCEPLDDLSATAVCKKIRSRCDKTGMAAILATAAPDRLIPALQPDVLVELLPGRNLRVRRLKRLA